MISDRRIKAINLCQTLRDETSLQKSRESFSLYYCSNELDFDLTLTKISETKSVPTEKIKAALLVGDSNLPSMLPELVQHTDVVICNDINIQANQHSQFLISCLKRAKSHTEFKELYCEKIAEKYSNPLCSNEEKIATCWELLTDTPVASCKNKHFLSSNERFLACKTAAEALEFSWTVINVFERAACQTLQNILEQQTTVISILNVTNLQHYDRDRFLRTTVPILLKNSENPLILCSIGMTPTMYYSGLKSRIFSSLPEYIHLLDETYEANYTSYPFPDKECRDQLVTQANNYLDRIYARFGTKLTPRVKFTSVSSNYSTHEEVSLFIEETKKTTVIDGMDKRVIQILKMIDPWRLNRYEKELEKFNIQLMQDLNIPMKMLKRFIRCADLFISITPQSSASSSNTIVTALQLYGFIRYSAVRLAEDEEKILTTSLAPK